MPPTHQAVLGGFLFSLQGVSTPCLSCPSIPVDQSDTQHLIARRLLALGKLSEADIAQATALNLDQVQCLARTNLRHPDFADECRRQECRRQSRLVAQADMADTDLPRFLDAALADR